MALSDMPHTSALLRAMEMEERHREMRRQDLDEEVEGSGRKRRRSRSKRRGGMKRGRDDSSRVYTDREREYGVHLPYRPMTTPPGRGAKPAYLPPEELRIRKRDLGTTNSWSVIAQPPAFRDRSPEPSPQVQLTVVPVAQTQEELATLQDSLPTEASGSGRKRRRIGGSLPTDDVYKAAANAAYGGPGPAGYILVFSSDTLKVWKDPKDTDLLVGVRGTYDLRDMRANVGIAFNNLHNTQRYKKDEADLLAVAKQFPNSKFHFASHSLGGAISRRLEELVPTLSSKGFNPAFEPGTALNPGKQQRMYKGQDFLGKIGKYLPGSSYKPIAADPSQKTKWYDPRTWRGVKDHFMSGFGVHGGAARTYAKQAVKKVAKPGQRLSARDKFENKTNQLAVQQWGARNESDAIVDARKKAEAQRIGTLLKPYVDNYMTWAIEGTPPTFEQYIKETTRWNQSAANIVAPYNDFKRLWHSYFPQGSDTKRDADMPDIDQFLGNRQVYMVYLDYVKKWKATKGPEHNSKIPFIEEYYEDQAKWIDELRSALSKGSTIFLDILKEVPYIGILSGIASDLVKGKSLKLIARNAAIRSARDMLNTMSPGVGTAAATAAEVGLVLLGQEGMGRPRRRHRRRRVGGEKLTDEEIPMTRRERKALRRLDRLAGRVTEKIINDGKDAPWNPVDQYREAPPIKLIRVSRVNAKIADPYRSTVIETKDAVASEDNRNYSVVSMKL